MRTYLQPLCPKHHRRMVFAELWLKIELSDLYPKPCYACEEPGCLYHYDIIHGYFTTREGEHIERDMSLWQKCPHEGLPMYMSAFDPQKSKRVWSCAQVDCIGGRTTEGELKVVV